MPAQILIADDYEDAREVLRFALEGAGYVVYGASDGAECVRLAQVKQPDVALIDISMPVLDGWSVLKELRKDIRTKHISCVALTAHTSGEDRQRALEAGFDGYLGKPYRTAELLSMVAGFALKSDGKKSDDRA